jgi:hypothetical protein
MNYDGEETARQSLALPHNRFTAWEGECPHEPGEGVRGYKIVLRMIE